MPYRPLRTALASGALALAAPSLFAQPFNTFDPVSMSMGGAGVALPHPATSTFFNPANLTRATPQRQTGVAFGLSAGGRAYDPDDVIEVLSDVSDDLDALMEQVEAYNAGMARPTDLAAAARSLDANMLKATGRPAQVEVGAAAVLGVPRGGWGMGLTVSAQATVGARVHYLDSPYINAIADAAESGTPATYDEDDLQSDVEALGMAISEVGLTFAKSTRLFGRSASFGVTPKLQNVDTLYYRARIADVDADDIKNSEFRESYSDFNVDLGAAVAFSEALHLGLVVKNLIPRSYDTVVLNGVVHDLTLDPVARIGLGYSGGWYRAMVDADLTKNKPVAFEQGSRYIALGGELDVLGWAALRAGYRFDTVDSSRSIPSIGVGLSPFGVLHIDVAVARTDREIGVAAQLALTF